MAFRIAVLISGTGSLLQALLDAQAAGELRAEVAVVGSDNAAAQGLQRAAEAGVPSFVHPFVKGSDRAAWDAELTELLVARDIDLVVLAGFMKLVGPAFLARFGGRTINTHPALLPSFPGMHGPRDALEHGVKVTGTTVFEVDAGVDTGRILAQEPVRVLPDDTVDSLHERIKVAERVLLVHTVNDLASQGDS
ncbi:phosphoribosylglycinamide formyltransferase [Micropruina sp.]|uniref:phosphoribosylglycinamide formyltransferase n=1 Tax=Micropruina sp. TaxID=2737536 RepID=UPI002607DA2D|nr:phosphoribosylglycinamide formyltransferase [Micropruina sp.]